ncbi:hypothetical protein [Psychrobacter sp. AOP31-A1-22]|uniref:hypothetical protein n=1 Tax=Psychrobacter sp. AOP31-A1-22 TaxID=3457696 RepID=UPI004035C66C
MTQTVSKTQWPDYSEYGLYLLPRNYQSQYGFSEENPPGRCLLLLDIKESITNEFATAANLRRLLHDADKKISLYLVLPKKKTRKLYEYPTQSEILQKLGLSYVARTQVITPAAATKQFRDALGDLRYDTSNLLDFSQKIGVNSDGDTVFFSAYGRYIERYSLDDDGNPVIQRIRASQLPLASCLYVLDKKGEVDQEALSLCVDAYLKQASKHSYDPQSAKQFAQLLFQVRPEDIKIGPSLDITTSIIGSVINEATPLDLTHWQAFNNMMLVNENVQLHQDMLANSNYQAFFHHTLNQTNNRHRLSAQGKVISLYKASVPAPLAPILASLLLPYFDGSLTDVYSPSIGNGALLAGFKYPLNFNVNEPDSNNFALLKRFTEWSDRNNKEEPRSAGYFITNKEIGAVSPTKTYDLSLALLPTGMSPISTLIPFLDDHGGRHLSQYTDMLDQTLMIETLNERNPDGRSVFLGPIGNNSEIGKIGGQYVRLLQWLQAYFHDVSVVDLSESLFNQTILPAPSRLYVIGAVKERPRNPTVLNERISHLTESFNIPVFSTYSQLIEFEQAVRLIDTSKRRPEIDMNTNNVVDNEGHSIGAIDEEQSLISLFYTLRPKPKTNNVTLLKNPKANLGFAMKSRKAAPMSLYISNSGESITEEQAHNDTEDVSASTHKQPSKAKKPPNLDLINALADEADDSQVDDDDIGGRYDGEGPDDMGFDIDILAGKTEFNEPDIEGFEGQGHEGPEEPDNPEMDSDARYQSLGDVIITRRTAIVSSNQYQSIDDSDHAEGLEEAHGNYALEPEDGLHQEQQEPNFDNDDDDENDDDENDDDESEDDENEDTQNTENTTQETESDNNDSSEGEQTTEDVDEGATDSTQDDENTTQETESDNNDSSEGEQTTDDVESELDAVHDWFDGADLEPVYYGPRYIDEPQKYLIKRNASNSNQLKATPPIFNPDNTDPDADKIFAHEISKFKNKVVRAHLDRVIQPTAQSHLKSLSIAESHTPALLIIKGRQLSTLQALPLYDFADGEALLSYIQQEKDGYDINSIFSLSSYQHNTEVSPILTKIEQMNTWLQLEKKDALTINILYEVDVQDFSDLYQLARQYHATVQPSIGRTIKHDIKALKPHGEARLYEYKARYWVRNPEFIAEKAVDMPFCLAFEPESFNDDELTNIANRIVALSNQNVYKPAFSQDFKALATFLLPTDALSLVNEIAARLATPKELSFLVFMRLTVQMNALFLAGAHRFFLYTCNIDSYKEWLGKLYSHSDASNKVLNTKEYLASQALDVDYARHLLKNPIIPFDGEAVRQFKIRYNSDSSYQQSASKVQIQAQQDVQLALMHMQELWKQNEPGFSINAWFSEHTLVDANTVKVEVVDMVFMAVTNTLLKRPTYLYSDSTALQLTHFLEFVASILDRLNINTVCTATGKPLQVAMHASTEAGVSFVQSNTIHGKTGIDCVIAVHGSSNIDALKDYGTATTIHYIKQPPPSYAGTVKHLCQLGQLLPLHKSELDITLRTLPHTANQHIMTEVYEQYSRAFDGMRQLGMLAYKIAGTLKQALLDDLLLSCSSSPAFSWWYENQDTFLYGVPTESLIAKRKTYLADLNASVALSEGDKAALHAIEKGVALFLPNIKTCNADAWLSSIYRHLTASLQSPQVVTESLEFIKNGLQPILLMEEDYDDLLHHVLVSEQGRSLPFSQMFELKSEKQSLHQELASNPTDSALLARLSRVNDLLADFQKQRQDEVLALVHQKKTFDRPLIIDALRCFLHEVGQFYIQDTTGTQRALKSSDARQVIEQAADYTSFRQLLNTLMQMIDDNIFAKLPLSTIDVIAQQLKHHGHSLSYPSKRPYVLQASDSNNSSWFLDVKADTAPTQIDMHIITSKQANDITLLRHPARQARLMLASLPSNAYKLDSTKVDIDQLAPLLSQQSEVIVWTGTPLSAIDSVRHDMLSDYLAGTTDTNPFLSSSAQIAASQYLHTVMHLVPTAHVHINSDMAYLLSLIAQKPKAAQQQHLASLQDKLLTQSNLNDSVESYDHPRLPQAVFTRRTPAQSKSNLSVHALLAKQASINSLASSSASLFLGREGSIHDIYYKDHYKPMDLDAVLNQAAKLTIAFKNDLNNLIDNHPDKDRIYTSLADHESNPEADYFIELDDNKKKAYVYKHLVRDMAYRGIKHRIASDLYDNQNNMPALFNTYRALIAHELVNTSDRYQSVRVLCELIQELTGVSKYAEQLQAQLIAKDVIDYQVDAVCQLSSDDITLLKLPVITCRPKPHLKSSVLSRNVPAISRMFGRYFSEVAPNDNVFLGKNEWLITCGFKLPHYERVFDLNNLVCYVANVGNDANKAPTTFLTNARHLYTDYVERKALLVESTHDVYQGNLTLVFEPHNAGFKLRKKQAVSEIMPHSLPITWQQLETDMQLFGETKGIGYEQVLMGENEYYAYCKNAPDLFEPVRFNDVSGKYHTAMRMTDQAKARFLNFRTFFEHVIPLKPTIVIDYLTRSLTQQSPTLIVSCYSNVIDSSISLEVIHNGDMAILCIEAKRSSAGAQLAGMLSGIDGKLTSPQLFKHFLFDSDIALLVKELGLSGFYVTEADSMLLSTTEAYAENLLSSTENIGAKQAPSLSKKTPIAMIGRIAKTLTRSV